MSEHLKEIRQLLDILAHDVERLRAEIARHECAAPQQGPPLAFPHAEMGAVEAAEIIGVETKTLYRKKGGTSCLTKIQNGRKVSYHRAQVLAHVAIRQQLGRCDGSCKDAIDQPDQVLARAV